ncbi:MAG: ABC transporter ATP-binding protein [Planctomycetota bacterium]|nr:ABC transporter ATP-binding protein [Planctomycetota bacterium]
MTAAILEARSVSFDYPGPLRAIDSVDLTLAPGELLLVIGPNGSGKSTLLKLLGGLLTPDSGQVLLQGRPVAAMRHRERARRMAVVPQYLPTLFEVTVESFVRGGRYAHTGFWRRSSGRDRDVLRSALEEADAADLGQRLLSELSGGQRQRVLVARALAQEADLLLFDEPTASLDPEHQMRVFELISGLVQRGRAAVVVTHELNLASQFATRLALLSDGRIVHTGPADEVLARDVLEPVYGSHLLYRSVPDGEGGTKPLVVPWLAGGR